MGRSDVGVQADTRPGQYLEFSAITIKKRSLALFFMRLPVFVPFVFIARGWFSLNQQDILGLSEADVLGTGGVFCFYIAISITPLITLTGAQWIAPLRRWYGIWFAIIGICDSTTAAITTGFAGGGVRPTRRAHLPPGRANHHHPGPPCPGHGQHPGTAQTREVLEKAAKNDVRHLGIRHHPPGTARRAQAFRRKRRGR
jgi:hypothetical protein